MADLLLADVNNGHPVTDWVKYREFSRAIIAKMTEGETFLAPTFPTHREAAKEHGMLVFGAYHFWTPGADPIKQAKNAVRALGEMRRDPLEFLLLDVEGGSDFDEYVAFCEHTDAELGTLTWMYGGHQLKDFAPHRPRWIARFFDHTPNAAHAPGIDEVLWQFTDRHFSPGVDPGRKNTGNDCSVFRGTVEQLHAFIAGGRMATLDKDDLDAIANVVRKTLNEGTGHGQQNWAGTSEAVLASVQGNHNDLRDIKGMLDDLRDAVGPGGKALVEAIAQRIGH